MLSYGEFVVNAASTRRHGVLLEAIKRGGVPAFANGGPVGRGSYIAGATTRTTTFSPTIAVIVQGFAGGSKEENEEMGKNIGNAINARVDAKFAEMLQSESRPGGSIARKRFSA